MSRTYSGFAFSAKVDDEVILHDDVIEKVTKFSYVEYFLNAGERVQENVTEQRRSGLQKLWI